MSGVGAPEDAPSLFRESPPLLASSRLLLLFPRPPPPPLSLDECFLFRPPLRDGEESDPEEDDEEYDLERRLPPFLSRPRLLLLFLLRYRLSDEEELYDDDDVYDDRELDDMELPLLELALLVSEELDERTELSSSSFSLAATSLAA